MTEAHKTCFIAMPVRTTPRHAEVYDDPEHWLHVMESLFVPAVEKAGFEPLRPVARGSHLIHAQIVQQLEQADMVLCDMSENNPNVFFELGVRTSVNKPVTLVRCDASVSIPFDVSGINTHTYNPSLKPWNITEEIEALADHITEAEASCAGTNPLWRQFGLTLTATEPTSDESKEEAMISIVSEQIAQLTHQVDRLQEAAEAPVSSAHRHIDHGYVGDLGATEATSKNRKLRLEAALDLLRREVAKVGDHHQVSAIVSRAGEVFWVITTGTETEDAWGGFVRDVEYFAKAKKLQVNYARPGHNNEATLTLGGRG